MNQKLFLLATALVLSSKITGFASVKKQKTSGIYGKITQIGFPPNHRSMGRTLALPGEIVGVFDDEGDEVARATAGEYGKFKITLSPGTYRVVPIPPDPDPHSMSALSKSEVTVKVWQGFYTPTYAQYDGGW